MSTRAQASVTPRTHAQRRKTKHAKTLVVTAARAMLVKCNPVGATKADAPDAAAAAKKQRAMQRQPIVLNLAYKQFFLFVERSRERRLYTNSFVTNTHGTAHTGTAVINTILFKSATVTPCPGWAPDPDGWDQILIPPPMGWWLGLVPWSFGFDSKREEPGKTGRHPLLKYRVPHGSHPPPRSLVRDGQTSPHRPRLVVSRSTCPPLSPSPHANSFIIGTTVINTHTVKHWTAGVLEGGREGERELY
jgi:hypothetical protein